MKLSIEPRDGGCIVRIDGAHGKQQVLLNAIRRCRQSAWACQSGECVNIESIAEDVDDRGVCLTLKPREGATLNPSGIAACLRTLLPDVEKG